MSTTYIEPITGQSTRELAEEMHALADQISECLHGSRVPLCHEDAVSLGGFQAFAQTFGDLFSAEDQTAAIQEWLGDVRGRFEALKKQR